MSIEDVTRRCCRTTPHRCWALMSIELVEDGVLKITPLDDQE